MGSIWEWGARVLFGKDEVKKRPDGTPAKPRVHGPAETYAPVSFTSKARGRDFIYKFNCYAYDQTRPKRNEYRMECEYKTSFWVLSKHVKPVMAAIGQLWLWKPAAWPRGRLPNVQTGLVHEQWTEIVIRGIW